MVKSDLSISDMIKKDQEMRQQNTFDVEVDLSNQSHLKKMIGKDPQMFLEKLNNPQDIEGVWLIAQHADNDAEFQKMILNLLDSNKDMISQKFNIPLQKVLSGIAMLTDRVMVNSSLSIDQQKSSEVSLGTQKYGTQGGIQNGSWVPRPIEMDGQKYFFESPE